jgi:hypothetical protein
LNDQKPPEGRLLTLEKLIAVPRTAGGLLSLLVQRKKPKKARPGAADPFLRFSSESALA